MEEKKEETHFEQYVAAMFEENCLHSEIKKEEFETILRFCIDYCLDLYNTKKL
ncbi:hypothetical protein K0U07_02605 [bacterium]|nr:hypothetical protein [bacterium]